METGCCQSGFPSHRSRGHGCLWGSDESSLLREDKKRKEERKEHFQCHGFPDLQVKDSRIYKPERERVRLEKEKETHRGEDRAQRQPAPAAECRGKGLSSSGFENQVV